MVKIGRPRRNYAPATKLNELQDEIREATKELAGLQTQIERLKIRKDAHKEEIKGNEKIINGFQERINRAKEEIKKAEAKERLKKVQCDNLLKRLYSEIAIQQDKLSQLEYIDGEINKSSKKLAEMKRDKDAFITEISLLDRKKIDLEKNILALELEYEANRDSLASEWAEIEEEKEFIKKEKERIENATETINVKYDRLKEYREELKSKYR